MSNLMQNSKFIAITGVISAGKSCLTTKLAKYLDYTPYYESVADNLYLEDFYKDIKTYAFPTQIYWLNHRMKQHLKITWSEQNSIQDSIIYNDPVFCIMLKKAGLLSERDFNTYMDLFKNMTNFLKKPDLVIFLDVKPEICFERMKLRARECENGVSLEYLSALNEEYQKLINNLEKVVPVYRVDYNEFKPVEEIGEIIKKDYLKEDLYMSLYNVAK